VTGERGARQVAGVGGNAGAISFISVLGGRGRMPDAGKPGGLQGSGYTRAWHVTSKTPPDVVYFFAWGP